MSIRERRACCRRRGRLFDRDALTREWRLVGAQGVTLEQLGVGGHDVACLENQQIARNDLVRRHGGLLAVAPDAGPWRRHRPQGEDRTLGAILLKEANDRVDHDDGADRDRIRGLAQHARDQGGAEQQEDHRALELAEEELPRGRVGPISTSRCAASIAVRPFTAGSSCGGGTIASARWATSAIIAPRPTCRSVSWGGRDESSARPRRSPGSRAT